MGYFSRHDLEHLKGICFLFESQALVLETKKLLVEWCQSLEVQAYLNIETSRDDDWWVLQVCANESLQRLTPAHNTIDLARVLQLASETDERALEAEIVLAMARSPRAYCFPSLSEFFASLRVRGLTARAARRTQLAFDTEEAERPKECWTYLDGRGFVLKPGVDLIQALIQTTQPAQTDPVYTFSCFRASEYVLLLALAQALRAMHPELLRQLEALWRTRALLADDFNDAFVHEHGRLEQPLPMKFYVPGDRVWFRNPDPVSAEIEGFEGSWVCYLGAGQFSNFWDREQPYTLEQKCLELYHWRHGVRSDGRGGQRMDEVVVQEHVHASRKNYLVFGEICSRMLRIRDGRGVYGQGGCVDASRDSLRWVCPETADIKVDNIVS